MNSTFLDNDKLIKYFIVLTTFMLCITRLSMALGQITFALSTIIFLVFYFKNKATLDTSYFNGYFLAIGVFILSLVPSILTSHNPVESLQAISLGVFYRSLIFAGILIVINKKEQIITMLTIFIAVTSIDCLVVLAQVLLGMSAVNRGWGFGSNVLTIAGIMTMLLPILCVFILDHRFDERLRKVSMFGFVSVIIGLLANKSRGAWLTCLALCPIVSWEYIKRDSKKLTVFALLIVSFFGFIALNPTYNQRFRSITNTTTDISNADRIWSWKSTKNMITDNPILGVGFDQFRPVYIAKYKFPQEGQNLVHTHNNFLQILAETGIVGLVGLIYMLGYFLWRSFKDYFKNKNPYDLLICSTIIGYLIIFGQIEYTLDNSSGMRMFWFLIASLLKLKYFEEQE